MKTNSNTQMCCAVLRLVTRNCCQHCRLCFDNVAGLSSCAGCCVSLFSSRSWAVSMITNCLEWLPSSLCYPHIPRLTAPRPATIKHDITRTDTMIPGSSIQSILGVASLSIIIHHYTGGHLQIILSQQHHSDCQHSVHICAINEMISMQCEPNVKCLQIPRYPGGVRSCLLSRISVASRVCCPSASAAPPEPALASR